MKRLIVISGMITLFISSCGNFKEEKVQESAPIVTQSYDVIAKYNWLVGTWQNISQEGLAVEKWEAVNDSTFIGSSYFVVGKDTVSAEKLTLEQKGKELFYVPIVKQNNNMPVYFKMTSFTETGVVFENPKHDFPQKITYNRITPDSMVAEISGTVEGKQQAQQFAMKRVN